MKTFKGLQGLIVFFLLSVTHNLCYAQKSSNAGHTVRTKDLVVQISDQGQITSIWLGQKKIEKAVKAFTQIAGCRQEGEAKVQALRDGSVEFVKTLVNDSLHTSCTLTERFIPKENSIRWELSIEGKDQAWGSNIITRMEYPVTTGTRFWTTWAGVQHDKSKADLDAELFKELYPTSVSRENRNKKYDDWSDPLIPLPFANATLYYGAPYLEYSKPLLGFWPTKGDIFSVPMYSILENSENNGLTVALSPEDNIIDMTLQTSKNGTVTFTRLHNRISKNKAVVFAMDLVPGENDWRGSLAWMIKRYPEYFNPKIPDVDKFGGTGAYSNYFSAFNKEKMKKMAFTVNWQASFDFPYMGMFIPPVKKEESWQRFGGDMITIKKMDDYARKMKDDGFYVFSYFNITEFGKYIKYPLEVPKIRNAEDDWKSSNDFLYNRLPNAILKVPAKMNYRRNITGEKIFGSWEGSIAMDCGDPAYQNFLLDQARRHITEIPNSFGICIDRMDWLRLFNEQADDGISWFDGKPARSLISSWKETMNKLGPVMHDAGKAILVNNHTKRLDVLNQVDGFFDEFTYAGTSLNATAFLALNKPALGWTDTVATIRTEGGDNFFQKYLYMGIYPMAPFPGNDHSIAPDPFTDKLYLDYGPLMLAMKERKWILEPHAISVKDNAAKVNIFTVPQGYAIPVVYAKPGIKTANITFQNTSGKGISSCMVYLPGKEEPVRVKFKRSKTSITMDVPLERGGAMVLVKTGK